MTHLHAGKEANVRLEQAKEIARIAGIAGGNAIVAGDLNAVPDSEVLSTLTQAGFADAVTEPAPTIPSLEPNRRIDYILPNSAGWQAGKAFTALDLAPESNVWKKLIAGASDHQPTVLEIAVP